MHEVQPVPHIDGNDQTRKERWLLMAVPMRFPVSIQTNSYVTLNHQIYYPSVYGLPGAWRVMEQVNRSIVAQVHSLFRAQQESQASFGGTTSMTGLYEIKNNQRGVLSLTQSNYAFTPPAAHGMTLLQSLTFDMHTGKAYSLAELFKPGSGYPERINEQIRVQIKEREIPLIAEFNGISAEQPYYIADKALVIYFQLYELTPYVYGFPMFPISVYTLQELLIEDGPFGRMLSGV